MDVVTLTTLANNAYTHAGSPESCHTLQFGDTSVRTFRDLNEFCHPENSGIE